MTKHMRNRLIEPKAGPGMELDEHEEREHRFEDLTWAPGKDGRCADAAVRFANGWSATFLRWPGSNSSIHMDPGNQAYYVGPYEILPWKPDGSMCLEGPGGEWPKHGEAADMQALMDLIAEQTVAV